MVVYTDKETNSIGYCCIEVFSNKYCDAEYVVLSDGSYEKIGRTSRINILAGVKSSHFL